MTIRYGIADMIDFYFPDASIVTKERLLEESFLLLSEQEDLEPEFAELMNKHFHELIKEEK